MKVICVTAITADKDKLKENHIQEGITEFHAFLDTNHPNGYWKIHKVPSLATARLNSMFPMVCPHRYLDSDIFITIGGQMRICGSLQPIIERLVRSSHDVAIFIHPDRDCIYEEGEVWKKKKPELSSGIEDQLNFYRQLGWPTHAGLVATGIQIRKNSEKVKSFYDALWEDMVYYTDIDQLSWPVVAAEHGIDVLNLKGNIFGGNGLVEVDAHNW